MRHLKVGCGGFAVSRSQYFRTFKTVEIGSIFQNLPRLATVEAWKKESPAGFEFSMRAFQVITHPASSPSYGEHLKSIPSRRQAFCGHFKPTPEVELAWDSTRSLAEALGARFIVFETPSSFYPDANHLRDMYRFFKAARRGASALVWQPKGFWEPKMAGKVCGDLGLILAVNPLEKSEEELRALERAALNYFRLPQPKAGSYADEQLLQVRRRCAERPSYVFFTHHASWNDAKRFEALGTAAPLARRLG